METQDVAELWANRMEVDNYNLMMQRNANNNNYYNNSNIRRPKTASRNYEPPGRNSNSANNKLKSNLWYLDLFSTDFNSSIAKGGS